MRGRTAGSDRVQRLLERVDVDCMIDPDEIPPDTGLADLKAVQQAVAGRRRPG